MLNNKDQITEYVERVFELYGINKYDFFYTYDDDTDQDVIISLFDDSIETEEETLNRISIFLGLSKREIVSMDKRAALRYWIKYPFFSLYNSFLDKWIWNARYKSEQPSTMEQLLHALFDSNIEVEERYNLDSIRQRLIEKLKQLSKLDSDYYMEGRRLKILHFQTAEFFSFPDCPKMIRSYIDMVNRVQELFYKAIKRDLSLVEMHEYNFLVAYLDVRDLIIPGKRLFYHNVVDLRYAYKTEGYKEFWSYAKIHAPLSIEQPWRCLEFFNDMSLVQQYVGLFPAAKESIRKFSLLIKNFSFTVRWEKTQSELDDEFVQAYIDDEDYDPRDHQFPPIHLYVEKTNEELAGYEIPLNRLRKAASPPSMGGLVIPVREQLSRESYTSRLLGRMSGR